MLTRYFILVISSLFIKDISCLQNDSNNISNIIMNTMNGGQSQGIIQKSLNQIASNRGLPINLQQILNSRQATNGQQQQNTQQNLNSISPATTYVESTPSLNLQSLYQQSTPTKGYHQSLTVQRPASPSSVLPNTSILQNNNYADLQNPAMGNIQFIQQQTPGMASQTFGTQPSAIIAQSYPTAPSPSAMQPVMNVPASYNGGHINTISESSFPQNQQVPIMGVPSYVLERSESAGYVQTPQFPTATVNSPPITFYSPQENLQTIDLSNIEYPNQMAIVSSVSPQAPVNPSYNPQQVLENYIYGLVMSPNTYGAQYASVLTNSGSKSSTLKVLLPLILNMLRERNNNNCDCCPNCGCNKNNQQLSGDGCGKQNRYTNGYKPNQSVRYNNDDSAEHDNRSENENRMRCKRKNKKVKIDDSYEDYDREDDYD